MTVLNRGSKMLTELLVSSCEADLESRTHQPMELLCEHKMPSSTNGVLDERSSMSDSLSELDDAISIVDGSEEHSTKFSNNHPYFELKHSFARVPYIHSFDWHPTIKNRLLLSGVTSRGETFAVVEVNNFVTCSISPDAKIAQSSDNRLNVYQLGTTLPPNGYCKEPDISIAMHTRALQNYGTPGTTALDAYIRSCKDVVDTCPYANADLKWVWKWIWQMIYITEWRPEVYGTWFPGVLQVMQHSLAPKKIDSTTERKVLNDPMLGRIRVYKGKERDRVLRLCGWPPFDDIARLDVFIDENISERSTHSRAVAAAIFTGHTGRMKKILLEMLETAKSLNERNKEEIEKFYDAVINYRGVLEHWRPISDGLKEVIKDPYFAMILTFLNGRCENYNDQHQILRLERVPIEDRIAFAAIHFNDQLFIKSIKALFNGTSLYRRLTGLFITGLSQHWETHKLLNEYVNDTGDVQTATILLITGHCFAPVLPKSVVALTNDYSLVAAQHDESELMTLNSPDEIPTATTTTTANAIINVNETTEDYVEMKKYVMRSYCCVQDYLEMLNMWSMWMQRARLDCLLQWKKIYEFDSTSDTSNINTNTNNNHSTFLSSNNANANASQQLSAELSAEPPEVNAWPSLKTSELEVALGRPQDDRAEAEVCCQFCACPVTLERPELAVPISSTLLVPTNRATASASSCSVATAKSSKSVNTAILLSNTRDVACQQCYKPLPKCVLCRRHMGTLTTFECPVLGALSSWFTWCQRCHHGGHMIHLWHWFAKHDECAASGCLCNCDLADLNMSFADKVSNLTDMCTCSDGI